MQTNPNSNSNTSTNTTNSAFEAYKEQALNTLAPGEVLVKLFDELLKQCRISVKAIAPEQRDYGKANAALVKAQTILSTLAASLDMRYPISAELKEMYIFIAQQLLKANVQKDAKLVEDCVPLLKDLRDSFDQAEKISRRQQAAAVGGKAAV